MTESLRMPRMGMARTHHVANWRTGFALVSFGALFSLILSGYSAGEENNFYQLPILGGLYHEPQFSNDPFIQSLRFYASGFWQLLSGRMDGPEIYVLLFVFQLLSRMILFAGMLSWASLLGIESDRERLAFIALVALSSTLNGFSNAGVGGLLITSFTHSEVANGTTLLALAWAARGSVTTAFAMNGVTFFLNAFVAVWTAVPLGLIILAQWWQGRWTWRGLLVRALAGLAIFAILAEPVVRDVEADPYTKVAPGFDYVAFLESFFPYHFLIWSDPLREIGLLAVVFCCGMLAVQMLRAPDAFLAPALGGAAVVWVAGVVLPYITHARVLLDLHLLRSGSTIHLLAAIAIAALATRWCFSRNGSDRSVWAPSLIMLSCTFSIAMPLALLLLLSRRLWPATTARWCNAAPWLAYAGPALLLMVALFNGARIYHAAKWSRTVAEWRGDWQALGSWARTHTPVQSVFFVPAGTTRGTVLFAPNDGVQNALAEGGSVFAYFSHRQAWVFSPYGAAVMWAPAYYATWRTRLTEAKALKTLPERLRYAAGQGIGYVVDGCAQPDPHPASAARFGRLCVFAVPRNAAG
ncbi:hypothetical protein JUN65_11750 [Gluconacetobacter azotocaptans]|uniref:hypothetical protein n=1 Tax=Gluconacetobacter azotocaptans TaxID=142834 RepID=UPI00195D703C|nr:hypothetical protein [Gluconacetobacter azotocaptans]MBM9402256.1 hypothetical protein [Gluconacetobacter azotocaptans]